MNKIKAKKEKRSIAEQVFAWIEKYPYIIWSLRNDLINYSSLARKIQQELSLKNFDAILIALRRYKENIKIINEEEITKLLKESSLEIKTGVNVYIIREIPKELLSKISEFFHLIRGTETSVIITNKKLELACLKKHERVVEVRIKSPEQIEKIAGVISTIYNKLSERGINLIETYSAYTDTIFIIVKKDLAPFIEVLEKLGIN